MTGGLVGLVLQKYWVPADQPLAPRVLLALRLLRLRSSQRVPREWTAVMNLQGGSAGNSGASGKSE